MQVVERPDGEWVCEHGVALDVHCCHCHSGFQLDQEACTCALSALEALGLDAEDD